MARGSFWVCVLLACAATLASAQCPVFDVSPLPECEQRSDFQLCVLAAHKDSDRLADFEFIDIPAGLKDADVLACKLRMSAIRQHVLYHGARVTASHNCKRAAALFKTNLPVEDSVEDVCEQAGFPKCGVCFNGGHAVLHSNDTCSCKCAGGWKGRRCQECGVLPIECLHEGNVSTREGVCGCDCEYPYSGVYCDQCNRRCAHGGFADPTDPRCYCQCAPPWVGAECKECSLKCQHGGKKVINGNSCECDCPVLAEGPQCEQCTARCLNGGVLDKATCTCKCAGGFTGHQCETCDIKCQHNSTFVPNECRCKCTNPHTSGPTCSDCNNTCHGRGREVGCQCVDCDGYWGGNTCNNCSLRCQNEGELDSRSCKCSCDRSRCHHGQLQDDCACECDGFWRGEMCHRCHLNCRHGTLNPDLCTCKCDGYFSGVKCDKCERSCEGRGLLDATKCLCHKCNPPYYGHDCQLKCNKTCLHGSVLNATSCQCEKCVLPWLGDECHVCKLEHNLTSSGTPCVNGAYDADKCQCQCQEGWTGERCDKCARQCAHGSLNVTTCSCSCAPRWAGVNCTDCTLSCENGGSLDKKNCFCNCDSMHSGTTCQGGPCHMQQACDSCLSVSDGCEFCAKTSSCSKKPGPGGQSSCLGPVKQGHCPPYGNCDVCDYTPFELRWLSQNGDATTGSIQDHASSMPETPDDEDREEDVIGGCNTQNGETWCARKDKCVQDWVGGLNGPCNEMTQSAPSITATNMLNGFISSDVQVHE